MGAAGLQASALRGALAWGYWTACACLASQVQRRPLGFGLWCGLVMWGLGAWDAHYVWLCLLRDSLRGDAFQRCEDWTPLLVLLLVLVLV